MRSRFSTVLCQAMRSRPRTVSSTCPCHKLVSSPTGRSMREWVDSLLTSQASATTPSCDAALSGMHYAIPTSNSQCPTRHDSWGISHRKTSQRVNANASTDGSYVLQVFRALSGNLTNFDLANEDRHRADFLLWYW